jgi:hypothetical protein
MPRLAATLAVLAGCSSPNDDRAQTLASFNRVETILKEGGRG